MSRILRRPMFRGGRVSSYGTGIAAPLVPGYRGGGQIGGGIIYGKPMMDGRYGFQNPTMGGIVTIDDILSITKAPMTGQQILDYATQNNLNLGEDFKINKYSKYIPEEVDVEVGTEGDTMTQSWGEYIADKGMPEMYDKDYLGKGDTQGSEIEGVTDQVTVKKDATGKVVKDAQGNPIYVGKTPKLTPPAIDTSLIDQKVLNNQNTTDDAELSLEEIKEALGAKKAFGRDATDMLLGFAGAKGDTVMEKFQDFAATEAKKGPSRTEKIDEAAATIMLKDKLGARSDKRKIDLMKAEVDYKIGAGKKLSIGEGVLASTKGTSFSDKKLAGAIQVSTSDNTGERYKFKGVTDSAGLKANITNGNLKVGDTVIVKETIKVKGQPDKVIKKIVEVVMKDGKLDVETVYTVN